MTDLEQLLQLLSDDSRPSGQMVRPMKARAMFASRACRKSVMIGKTLTKGQMSQVSFDKGTRLGYIIDPRVATTQYGYHRSAMGKYDSFFFFFLNFQCPLTLLGRTALTVVLQ